MAKQTEQVILWDAHDLKTAIAFVRRSRKRPEQIRVDIKGWVRIKRDLNALSMVLPTPYSPLPSNQREVK